MRTVICLAWVLLLSGCVINLPADTDDGGLTDAVSGDAQQKNCGNGVVDPGELCDTAIEAGKVGACPTSCDDGLSCTSDTIDQAGTCQASCTFDPIVTCNGGDGCCATGCTPANDDDCVGTCGNGKIDVQETCDTAIPAGQPGACPTDCADTSACTDDSLLSANTCSAQCRHTPVTMCADGDGCCPQGCTTSNDDDCSPSCGDGVLDSNEKCDTAIATGPGACPTSCNDGNACTTDSLLNAGGCNAQCTFSAITQCRDGDNCCPSACNANTDNDCSPTCGNGAIEGNEQCDTAVPQGTVGACPTSCNDNKACTADTLLNPGTCGAQCVFTSIQQCRGGDGCCPAGCNANNDSDCSPSCGNGSVESGEQCDTAIPAGQAGACPTDCDDQKPCTVDTLIGGGCSAQCTNTNINSCTNDDGCCPPGCNANNDNDCTPQCGNSVVEAGETCDPPGSCPTSCTAPPCKVATLQGSAASCTAECVVGNAQNGSSCTGGTCHGGSCCTGCWDGSSCRGGGATTACGSGGSACAACTSPSPCKVPACSNGSCTTNDYTCTIDVVAGTHNCTAPVTQNALSPGVGRFTVDLDSCSEMSLTVRYCNPTAWAFHVGNSPSNNGGGGDAAQFSNDSELQVYNGTLSVISNDYNPGVILQSIASYVPSSGCVERSMTISDGRVVGDQGLNVISPYVFRLDQPDNEGTPDALLYIGLNRVFEPNSTRTGSGVERLDITLR